MSQLATLSLRFLCHLSSSHSFLTVLAAMCCIWFPRSQLCLCYLWVAVVRHGLVLLEVPVASLPCPSVAWSLLRRRLPFHVYLLNYGQCFFMSPKKQEQPNCSFVFEVHVSFLQRPFAPHGLGSNVLHFGFHVRSFVFATFGWGWCVMGLFCWKFLWQASPVHRLLGHMLQRMPFHV